MFAESFSNDLLSVIVMLIPISMVIFVVFIIAIVIMLIIMLIIMHHCAPLLSFITLFHVCSR